MSTTDTAHIATNTPAKARLAEGAELYRQAHIMRALACFEEALQYQPEFPAALHSRGLVLRDMGRLDEAIASFERALQIAPKMARVRFSLGETQLKLGRWASGWENYEARLFLSAAGAHRAPERYPLPHWSGQAGTEHQNLLVVTEQGFGDVFQFCRYLELASEKFRHLGFVGSPATMRLMQHAFGDKVMLLDRLPADSSAWDWQCPLMSLPRAFHTSLDNIPSATPYLGHPEAAGLFWQDRLRSRTAGKLKIGIAWAGRKTHLYDARRSLKMGQLAPLLQCANVSWVSLQKAATGEARPAIPASSDWLDWTVELTNFIDTAALISNLDLVISIDTSIVHLAGALGKRVWLLNRFDGDWRWLQNRRDSPWYPTLEIFSQTKFGDWTGVIETVANRLRSDFP